jgi:hypothetical protein
LKFAFLWLDQIRLAIMTTRDYVVVPHKEGFRITIKKKKTPISKIVYDHIAGYDSVAAANLDVFRYQEHVAVGKHHSSFIPQTSVPQQTPSKQLKVANESMRRVKQRLNEQELHGVAYDLKLSGLKKKYSLYLKNYSGLNNPPLLFVDWEILFMRKTPEQRARYFRSTCRGALMRDQISLGDITSPDTDIRVKGLQNSMRYMTQSIEHVTKQNQKLSDQFNRLSSCIRLKIVVFFSINKLIKYFFFTIFTNYLVPPSLCYLLLSFTTKAIVLVKLKLICLRAS